MLQDITERLMRFEAAGNNKNSKLDDHTTATTWQPAHVVMEVWPQSTHIDEIVAKVKEFWNQMSEGVRRHAQMPYVPWPHRENEGGAAAPHERRMPAQKEWAAVECSPEAGQQRRRLKVA